MTRKPSEEMCETGGATLCLNEDTGLPYWELWGADWKDSCDMEDKEVIEFCPTTFPLGTKILIIEPGPDTQVSQDFYQDIFNKNR
jgi:hypothetical protein